MNRPIRHLALATVASVALMSPAAAVEEQTFKITQVFASTHWHNVEGIQTFVKLVNEASEGKITFEEYHGGALGKESTQVVTSGLADMGILVPSYEVEKLPLTSVVELPGFHTSSCEGTHQYWDLSKEGGAIYENEYKPLGIRPLYVMVLTPYEVQTKEKVIESVADMQGVKLRANGAMAKAVAAVGGTPVQVTSNEFYDALARGTVDGGMWLTGSTRQVGLEGMLNHTVKGTAMGGGATFFGISEKVFQGLDADTRKILVEAGAKVTQHMCEYLDRMDAEEEKALTEAGKLTLHHLSPEEAALWNEKVSTVAAEWAGDMDKSGRPGTAVLEAYRVAAEAH